MAERTWKWVTAQRISTAFSRCFGVFFVIVFVMSERKVSKFVLFFPKSWPSLIFNLFSCFYKFKRPCFFYFFLDCFLYAFTYSWVYILLSTNMHTGCQLLFMLTFCFPLKRFPHFPRGWGNLTFTRCPGVGNLTLASMKMSKSPGSAHTPPPPTLGLNIDRCIRAGSRPKRPATGQSLAGYFRLALLLIIILVRNLK